MKLGLATFASLIGFSAMAGADAPRSVIPWLSESVVTAPQTAASTPDAEGSGEIETTLLDRPKRDGMGLLSAAQTGFPDALWGRTSALRVRGLILRHQSGGVPEAQALFRRMLLAETKPPLGSTDASPVFLARLDRLIAQGHLDAAEVLVNQAGLDDPAIFRRAFDVALLTERSDGVCSALLGNPGLSPTFPARVFCLARGGDWDAAALTVTLGHELGAIEPEMEELLARFLDPEIFEDEEDPEIPDPLTPLEFVLRDAVALPRPVKPLPLAFLHIDVADYAPMRARIEAGERLIRTGAIASTTLFEAYRAGKPASSGGVWDHAKVVQDLDRALESGDPARISKALGAADKLFSGLELRLPFAQAFAEPLSKLGTDIDDAGRIFELLLLADEPAAAKARLGGAGSALLVALADQAADLPNPTAPSALEAAILQGLTRDNPPTQSSRYIEGLFDNGQYGEALLSTLNLLNSGFEIDPNDLQGALYLLRKAGLERPARRIGLEYLLLQPKG